MKKQQVTKEEFQRMEYEFSEYKEIIPVKLVAVMEKAFDLLRPYIELEEPLGIELGLVLRKLIQQEFSWMDISSGSWWNRWMDEIAEGVAIELADEITMLVFDTPDGKAYCDIYDDFDRTYAFYTKPHTARIIEVPDWTGEKFWEEMDEDERKVMIEDIKHDREQDYQQDKQACDLYNAMKDKFVQTVQPVVLKYINDKIEHFDSYMWQHFAIALGNAFFKYEEKCSDLEYAYCEDELTEDPGLSFADYNRKYCEEHFPEIYKPSDQSGESNSTE